MGRVPRAMQTRAEPDGIGHPIVVAYAANPAVSTSVCLIGAALLAHAQHQTGAFVIAHRRDQAALESILDPTQATFVGPVRMGNAVRWAAERAFPGRWGLISLLDLPDYLLFDLCAFLAVRRRVSSHPTQYVWRVNPVSFRFPSLLPYLEVPVITGPHNGGMEWPPGFAGTAQLEGDATGRVRAMGDWLHRWYGDAERYARIMVANEQCASTVPRTARDRLLFISENGVASVNESSPIQGDARKLLFVGRLNAMKAVDVAIRAMRRLPEVVELTIVGDGPQRDSLEALTDELGLRARVHFMGQVQHSAVPDFYSRSGVLLFPSVREAGGGVVLEAMSYGLPCIVAAWGGPAQFTSRTGIQCSVESPQALEDDIVTHVEELLAHPDRARAIGQASRSMVEQHYVWGRKVRRIHDAAIEAAWEWRQARWESHQKRRTRS